MKEIFMPATAKGYSHSALFPSFLCNNLWNDSGYILAKNIRFSNEINPPPRKSVDGSGPCQPISFQSSDLSGGSSLSG
uniref:ELMO domain-containing protein A n=1 Tax=Rhizophora mucronata TaxID=61149 RepID=A0A2P2KRZ8_RHIMU